ncbi:MAG TPA: glycosyltransferase [Acidiphilium sp.]|nr:MAG: glycosyl transferase [Acidiphilium sp. 21-60-14]OYV90788.1 MAG: glycosyl transferase [Acidiphilium sp. 37-60-79]OZB38659.1 MAG: glycosyl transferase [Acidiphilium sp. 34-60-192]HQT87325.1 glycosyltransferase [Acidiphilium sp.]HQU24911.1 glycosyltransferase [Acidiphilium sp.]
MNHLETARRAASPRLNPPPTPARSLLIHGAVFVLWIGLFANAFIATGLAGWSVGIVYITYDTLLLAFTFWQTFLLRHPQRATPLALTGAKPSLTIIVAAYNEAAVLAATIAGLTRQSDPPEAIIIADDGSTDASAAVLQTQFGLTAPALGTISSPSPVEPRLRWLRLPHGGKAQALNAALPDIATDLFLTVDADTLLDHDALAAMREAFGRDPNLVAATGVLAPSCGAGLSAQIFEYFQTYEYVRNFLGRFAWMQLNSLLLISGAFAGFRHDAVMRVGGFDPDCLVEDYELIHRLRRYGYQHDLPWRSAVLGSARARTSAPATPLAFLRQRRRWFGGFLQTQFWYRDMVGAGRYGALGNAMLPVKAIDTFQPIYGLCAFGLLLWYLITGKIALLLPVGGFIFGKIAIDLAFHAWSVRLYQQWVGGHTKVRLGHALLAAVLEPFSFQLFRHLGASWGWIYALSGQRSWGTNSRTTPVPITDP